MPIREMDIVPQRWTRGLSMHGFLLKAIMWVCRDITCWRRRTWDISSEYLCIYVLVVKFYGYNLEAYLVLPVLLITQGFILLVSFDKQKASFQCVGRAFDKKDSEPDTGIFRRLKRSPKMRRSLLQCAMRKTQKSSTNHQWAMNLAIHLNRPKRFSHATGGHKSRQAKFN